VEGEKLLQAGHLVSCGRLPQGKEGTIQLIARCLQTSSLKSGIPHKIEGSISTNGEIVKMRCSCKAGNSGRCKHVIAALMFCQRYVCFLCKLNPIIFYNNKLLYDIHVV